MNFLTESIAHPRWLMLVALVLATAIICILIRHIRMQNDQIRGLQARALNRQENPSWLEELAKYWIAQADHPQCVVDKRLTLCRCVAELREVSEIGFLNFLLRKATKKTPEPERSELLRDGLPSGGKTGW